KDCVAEKAKNCPADLKPIGTGPYKIDTFKPGDTVTYVINDNYREANKPFFKTVTLKGGGDAVGSARAVCQTGDADFGWNLQVEAAVLRPMVEAADTQCTVLPQYGTLEHVVLQFADPTCLGGQPAGPGTKPPLLRGSRAS